VTQDNEQDCLPARRLAGDTPNGGGPHHSLPPVGAERLQEAMRRIVSARKPPQGWPGEPPEEVRADDGDDDEERSG
jgi:hypothetical protein